MTVKECESSLSSPDGDGPMGDGPGDKDSDPGENGNYENDRCPFCFLNPCVAQAHQHVCGEGQAASDNNPPIRKGIYRRFWSIINNLGGWNLQCYTHKKLQEAQLANVVYLKREIMPECVIELVRGLYPNPFGQPYMGHKWE